MAPLSRNHRLLALRDREWSLSQQIKAAGGTSPYNTPNYAPYQLWDTARSFNLVTEAELADAKELHGDRWFYTGD